MIEGEETSDLIGSKQQQYKALVEMRKSCRLCCGLSNPAEAKLQQFDSDEIGPWTRLLGDLYADLMIVGQDWGDVRYYNDNQGLDNPNNPTTRNLVKLLSHIGIQVSTTNHPEKSRGVFLTNAILCLKGGGLQSKIERAWGVNCGTNFLRRQIEIVRPKVVVGLGAFAFHTVLGAFGHRRVELQDAIADTEGCEVTTGVRLFAAYHCGKRTVNCNRDLLQQATDWERFQNLLRPIQRTGAVDVDFKFG